MKFPIAIICSALFLSGCQDSQCNRLKMIVENPKHSLELEKWADENFFSRRFEPSDFDSSGGLVGPGRRSVKRDIGLEVPEAVFPTQDWIMTMRPLGPNSDSPEGIFIGERSFLGILIARGSLSDLLQKTGMSSDVSELTNGRVAVICGRDER